jgi:hypothetical protein
MPARYAWIATRRVLFLGVTLPLISFALGYLLHPA